jgi:hypothetical protein
VIFTASGVLNDPCATNFKLFSVSFFPGLADLSAHVLPLFPTGTKPQNHIKSVQDCGLPNDID